MITPREVRVDAHRFEAAGLSASVLASALAEGANEAAFHGAALAASLRRLADRTTALASDFVDQSEEAVKEGLTAAANTIEQHTELLRSISTQVAVSQTGPQSELDGSQLLTSIVQLNDLRIILGPSQVQAISQAVLSASNLKAGLARGISVAPTWIAERASELARESAAPPDNKNTLFEHLDWLATLAYGSILLATGDRDQAHNWARELSPVDDERTAFELVWGLVERAADTGRLPTEVENEVRTLNKLLAIVRHELDPTKYSGLFDEISHRIVRLLPDVVAVLFQANEAVPRSIELAAEGVGEDDLLPALADDLEEAADTLEIVEAAIGEQPDETPDSAPVDSPASPYFNRSVERIHQSFRRIDSTFERLATTRTGRAILRNATALAGGAVGAAGLAISDSVSAGTATIIATIGSWLWTRVRRTHTELPARKSAARDDHHGGATDSVR